MTIEIRPATPDDVPHPVQVHVDSSNEGFGELMPHTVVDEAPINRWTTELTNGLAAGKVVWRRARHA